jgi:hypothetical protein
MRYTVLLARVWWYLRRAVSSKGVPRRAKHVLCAPATFSEPLAAAKLSLRLAYTARTLRLTCLSIRVRSQLRKTAYNSLPWVKPSQAI